MKQWKIGLPVCLVAVCLGAMLVGCQPATYTPEGKSPAVSSSALGKAGTLRVGVNASSAPLAGKTSSSSRTVGIDVDVAAYLADELGLKVEIVDLSTDFASALSDGEVDMVLGVDSSEEASGYWRSPSYLDTGVALFGSSSESAVPTTDSSPKVAAQASSKSSWRVTNLFGDDALVTQENLKSAFDALANGSARYVAADAVIGTYVSYSNGYSDKIVALLQEPSGYCAATSESNAELQTAIDGAVKKLVSGGMMGIIENKWLGQTLDLGDVTVVKGASDNSKPGSGDEAPSEDEGGDEAGEDAASDEDAAEDMASDEAAVAEPYLEEGGVIEGGDVEYGAAEGEAA